LARQEDSPDKSIFLSMVNFFELHQSYDEALDALLVAREKYPEDIDFLLSSGRIYQEMGITYKAKEIYQKILILDANNEDARQRLELMEGIL
jgi:tetratricopeptide (TPR) repeat protein